MSNFEVRKYIENKYIGVLVTISRVNLRWFLEKNLQIPSLFLRFLRLGDLIDDFYVFESHFNLIYIGEYLIMSHLFAKTPAAYNRNNF